VSTTVTEVDEVRRRRRWRVGLLIVLASFLGGLAVFAAALVAPETVNRLWVSAELAKDGSARITEVVDYDFGTESRHGIYRDVPGLDPEAQASEVDVTMDGEPVPYEIEPYGGDDDETRVRIGDPDSTVSGLHRYRIVYRLSDVAHDGRLAWNAVGTGWYVELRDIEIQVTAPYALDDPSCVRGRAGSRTVCATGRPEPGRLTYGLGALAAHRGITVAADTGAALAVAPDPPAEPTGALRSTGRPGLLDVLLLVAGCVLLGGLVAEGMQRLAGREKVHRDDPAGLGTDPAAPVRRLDVTRLPSLVPEVSAPPGELTPAQGGFLLGGADSHYRTAWLLTAVQDGHVVVEGDGPHPVLVRPARADAPRADREVRETLDHIFAGRDRITLGRSYDRSFTQGWKRIDAGLGTWMRGLRDLRSASIGSRVAAAAPVALLAGVIGVVVGGVGAGRPYGFWAVLLPAVAALAGAGLMLTGASEELYLRTPRGNALWLRVEGFRRYLAGAGSRQVEEAAAAGVLDLYTLWAVALGEADRWSAAVAKSTTVPARPQRGPSLLTPILALVVIDAIASNTTPVSVPSSSSGSSSSASSDFGGGGSSVGDGAGGGGGGSW
jgi:uncharacterized membrane protein YgcG